MRLPRWFRHYAAHCSVAFSSEIGGELYDYANGKWLLLHEYKGSANKTVISLIEAMLDAGPLGGVEGTLTTYDARGRDAIYVCTVGTNQDNGVIQIVDSRRKVWQRYWAIGCYEPGEAFDDALKYLKKRALELGWRPIEEGEQCPGEV